MTNTSSFRVVVVGDCYHKATEAGYWAYYVAYRIRGRDETVIHIPASTDNEALNIALAFGWVLTVHPN